VIADSQVHLWKAHSPERPWPNPNAKPQLPQPFGYERLVGLMDEAGVDRVVIVPPSWEGNRNDYALEAAAKHPGRFGVMGRINVTDPKEGARFADWRQQPGMLGLRVTFLGPQKPWLTDGSADWLWPAAENAGLPIMFLAVRMEELHRIARQKPGLTLIVDHMGLSGEAIELGLKQRLLDNTVQLAKFPNVSVKLSSVPAYTDDPYPYREMTPQLKRIFEAYGPRRCYWGSDMTNSLAKATYRQRIEHFTQELDFFSAEDKDWVMGRALLARLAWA